MKKQQRSMSLPLSEYKCNIVSFYETDAFTVWQILKDF